MTEGNQEVRITRDIPPNWYGINAGHIFAALFTTAMTTAGCIYTIDANRAAVIEQIHSETAKINEKIELQMRAASDHEARINNLEHEQIADKASNTAFQNTTAAQLSDLQKSVGILIGQIQSRSDRH